MQECPQPEFEIDISLNFCADVYEAIDAYFLEEDQRCIVLLGEFRNVTRGERICNTTVRKLMRASRLTDVNATVNNVFCNGVIKGFSATLNGKGLKWVSDAHTI